jgi:hypothetical protein
MGDVEAALCFVARRQAQRSLSRTHWVHALSFDLGWMGPDQARSFVERAEAAGLLAAEGDLLRLGIDPATVAVPPRFRPRPDAAPEGGVGPSPSAGGRDGFASWLDRYAEVAGCDRTEALRRVAQRQGQVGGMLTADAALLWLSSEAGINVRAAAARLTL